MTIGASADSSSALLCPATGHIDSPITAREYVAIAESLSVPGSVSIHMKIAALSMDNGRSDTLRMSDWAPNAVSPSAAEAPAFESVVSGPRLNHTAVQSS